MAALVFSLTGCGSGSSSQPNALTLIPASANTAVSHTLQLQASDTVISWQTSCGTVTPDASDNTKAVFTAPGTVPPSNTCTITATAASNATAQSVDAVFLPVPQGTVHYTTWKNGNDHIGQQSQETVLTPSNVNSTTFGLKFTVSVDSKVYAQPLYLSQITVNGGVHNVVYVATEHDSVYAFDADQAGAPLWQRTFLTNGATTYDTSANPDIPVSPEVGITGTPVIDISNGAQTGVLYVVAETVEGGTYIHRLHALDVATGNDIKGSPVVLSAPGFSSQWQLQRPALILANGNVYVALGSQGDLNQWHGWIFAYSTNNLAQVAVWNTTPGGNGGAIWGGGAAISSDPQGYIYAATGNGDWDGTTQFSESWVKLSPTLNVVDFFTPYDQATLTAGDSDLGAGLPVLVPTQSGSAHPNELIGCGKPTPVYVVDRDHMGGLHTGSDSQIVQEVPNVVGGGPGTQSSDHCFTTPAYFRSKLYFIGNNDVIKMFTLDSTTGLLSTTPASQGSFTFQFPGGQPVVSSNGANNGIVWAVDYGSYFLHAYDASDLTKELYRSSSVGFTKWMVPTVINGNVYVASQNRLSVFGLF